jgi:hypothetical protein
MRPRKERNQDINIKYINKEKKINRYLPKINQRIDRSIQKVVAIIAGLN